MLFSYVEKKLEILLDNGMDEYELSYDEAIEWFYEDTPFIDVCVQNMIDLYELHGYPETWEEVPWFLKMDID